MKRRSAREHDEESGRQQAEHHRDELLARLKASEAARHEPAVSPAPAEPTESAEPSVPPAPVSKAGKPAARKASKA